MTEAELVLLGFEKNIVSAEESGDSAFHYYDLSIGEHLAFISCENTRLNNENDWFIELFEYPEFRWQTFEDAKNIIDNFNKHRYVNKTTK